MNSFSLKQEFGVAILTESYTLIYADEYFFKIINSLNPVGMNIGFKDILRLADNKEGNIQEIGDFETYTFNDIIIQNRLVVVGDNRMILTSAHNQGSARLLLDYIAHRDIEEHMNKAILDSLRDGITIADKFGNLVYVNDAFCSLSNLNKEDIIGESVFELIERGVVPTACCGRVVQTKQPMSLINNYYHGKSCLVSASPIFDANGELYRAVSIVRDVSGLQKLQEQVEKMYSLPFIHENDLNTVKISKAMPDSNILKNKQMLKIYERALKICKYDSSVLILGETGSGKDRLAKYIHSNSLRANRGPFIKVNCGAIPEHLLESELFGYEAGAFTGAKSSGKIGFFEIASEGTLFLDEIGDMPYHLQVKLLSAIQDKEIFRLGGKHPIAINPRIIAATNLDLKKQVDNKQFRADLFYRLNVISFTIPSLSDRKEDIIHLATEFLNEHNLRYNQKKVFMPQLYEALLKYSWPGNIRELKNVIERLFLMTTDDTISEDVFYEQVLDDNAFKNYILKKKLQGAQSVESLKQKLEAYEKILVEDAVKSSENLNIAAGALGIDLSTLVRKKKKYNL